uniref:Nucleotide exchange factor SIL1 n=1 Tax=Dermatophagoides pteronyssinus TaxID=6956 RepID=A0A6P6XVB5_DERPT|nr:nucleotide exchange factor SIL1-like [Dermatophagoides pteronyssinus]
MNSLIIRLLFVWLFFISFHYHSILGSNNQQQLSIKFDDENHQPISIDDENDDDDGYGKQQPIRLFQATNEWQQVQNDEILPKGLHVRINLETGRKEAKLLNEDNDDGGEMDVNSKITTKYQKILTKSSKEKIALMTEDEDRFLRDIDKNRNGNIEKKIHRNIDHNSESEKEILHSLLKRYNLTENLDEKISLLIDIEYFVHQIDLGKFFYDSNGFNIMMKDLLNDESFNQLKIEILSVFGSAIQGNMYVKLGLSGQNFLSNIVTILLENNNAVVDVLRKCFFVLSTYLRNNPFEQNRFFHSYDGKQILRRLFYLDERIAVKIITFLDDISNEEMNNNNLESKNNFFDSKFCQDIIELFINSNDNLEKSDRILLLESMINLLEKCRNEFRSNDYPNKIENILKKFSENNEFIQEMMENFLKSLSSSKDEL